MIAYYSGAPMFGIEDADEEEEAEEEDVRFVAENAEFAAAFIQTPLEEAVGAGGTGGGRPGGSRC